MEKTKYIVVRIGCIECGCGSGIVGVFDDENLANQTAEKCGKELEWLEGGQNNYVVLFLPKTVNEITEEFQGYLDEKNLNYKPKRKRMKW